MEFRILPIPFGQIFVFWTTELGKQLFNQVLGAQYCIEHIGLVNTNFLNGHLVDVLSMILVVEILYKILCMSALGHLDGLFLAACLPLFHKRTHSVASNWKLILLHWLSLSDIRLSSVSVPCITKNIYVLLILRYAYLVEVREVLVKLTLNVLLTQFGCATCLILIIVIRIRSLSTDS